MAMTVDNCAAHQEEMNMMEVCCKPILPADIEDRLSQQQDERDHLSDDERLQLEHHWALEALRQLAEGVRIVTRQMKQQHILVDDNDSVASAESTAPLRSRTFSSETVSVCSVLTEDDRRLHDLVASHTLELGADLLGLSQAAQMVNEHARLASHEASLLTDTMSVVEKTADEALGRAQKAETVTKRVSRENATLQQQLDQLKVDRKVLAREVKALRKENSSLKQFQQDYQRQETLLALEQHVRGALVVHEEQLAIAKRNTAVSVNQEEDSVEEVAAIAAPDQSKTGTDTFVQVSKTESSAPKAASDAKKNEAPVSTAPKKREPTKHAMRPVSAFGGAGSLASMSAYSYKFNRPKQPLKLSKKTNEAKISLETPTGASTAATENLTPESNAFSAADDASDKENDTKAQPAVPIAKSAKQLRDDAIARHRANQVLINPTKQQQQQSSGRNIVGDLAMASSTFTSFFSSRPSAKVAATDARPHILNLNDGGTTKTSQKNQHGLTIDSSQVPLSTVTLNASTLLSPFAEDSPVAAAANDRYVAIEMELKCDEQVLRSLSLPDDEDSVIMVHAPDLTTTRLEARPTAVRAEQ